MQEKQRLEQEHRIKMQEEQRKIQEQQKQIEKMKQEIKNHKCPKCDTETEVYARVVGYLRPVKQWNEGKQAEFKLRKNYKLGE